MPSQPSDTGSGRGLGTDLLALVRRAGTSAHPWPSRVAMRAERNLSDMVHYVAALHGRTPARTSGPDRGTMLGEYRDRITEALAEERHYLLTLMVAVGPIPGTPGETAREAAIIAQCHALDTLAQSDRAGCADGALVGLSLDWTAIRSLLDIAAVGVGIVPPPTLLPDAGTFARTLDLMAIPPACARAFGFGARQCLQQHHAMWDLLAVRARARRDA